jgi:transposase
VNVDALGNPLRIILTAGQRHESTQAKALLAGFESERVMGDSAYDANAIIGDIDSSGAEPIIPARSNRLEQRDYDRELYKERHLVECFIGKLKQYHRCFSRFDKLARNYLAFLYFASALIWLR